MTRAEKNDAMWKSFLLTKKTIAHRLVEAREMRSSTAREIIEKGFTNRYTITELENPSSIKDFLLWDIQQIANYLKINIKDLFNSDPNFVISNEIYSADYGFDRKKFYAHIAQRVITLKEQNGIAIRSRNLNVVFKIEQFTRIAYELNLKPMELF